MARRARRLALVSGLTAVTLFIVASLALWSITADVPYLTPFVLAASLLPAAVGLLTDRRWLLVPGLVVAPGLFAVFGGLLAYDAVCVQPVADGWSITYDWQTNVIRFGPTIAGDHLCRATPNRSLVVIGYLLASTGANELLTGRNDQGPIAGLYDRLRNQWTAES